MCMEARINLSNVSQEYTFCACAVLGKIALFRQNTVFPVPVRNEHAARGDMLDAHTDLDIFIVGWGGGGGGKQVNVDGILQCLQFHERGYNQYIYNGVDYSRLHDHDVLLYLVFV